MINLAQCGGKSSEIPEVRTLLKDSGLENQKVSLDAHHFKPITTVQVYQAGGIYLTQVKENQTIFLRQYQSMHTALEPLTETIVYMTKRMVVSACVAYNCFS